MNHEQRAKTAMVVDASKKSGASAEEMSGAVGDTKDPRGRVRTSPHGAGRGGGWKHRSKGRDAPSPAPSPPQPPHPQQQQHPNDRPDGPDAREADGGDEERRRESGSASRPNHYRKRWKYAPKKREGGGLHAAASCPGSRTPAAGPGPRPHWQHRKGGAGAADGPTGDDGAAAAPGDGPKSKNPKSEPSPSAARDGPSDGGAAGGGGDDPRHRGKPHGGPRAVDSLDGVAGTSAGGPRAKGGGDVPNSKLSKQHPRGGGRHREAPQDPPQTHTAKEGGPVAQADAPAAASPESAQGAVATDSAGPAPGPHAGRRYHHNGGRGNYRPYYHKKWHGRPYRPRHNQPAEGREDTPGGSGETKGAPLAEAGGWDTGANANGPHAADTAGTGAASGCTEGQQVTGLAKEGGKGVGGGEAGDEPKVNAEGETSDKADGGPEKCKEEDKAEGEKHWERPRHNHWQYGRYHPGHRKGRNWHHKKKQKEAKAVQVALPSVGSVDKAVSTEPEVEAEQDVTALATGAEVEAVKNVTAVAFGTHAIAYEATAMVDEPSDAVENASVSPTLSGKGAQDQGQEQDEAVGALKEESGIMTPSDAAGDESRVTTNAAGAALLNRLASGGGQQQPPTVDPAGAPPPSACDDSSSVSASCADTEAETANTTQTSVVVAETGGSPVAAASPVGSPRAEGMMTRPPVAPPGICVYTNASGVPFASSWQFYYDAYPYPYSVPGGWGYQPFPQMAMPPPPPPPPMPSPRMSMPQQQQQQQQLPQGPPQQVYIGGTTYFDPSTGMYHSSVRDENNAGTQNYHSGESKDRVAAKAGMGGPGGRPSGGWNVDAPAFVPGGGRQVQ